MDKITIRNKSINYTLFDVPTAQNYMSNANKLAIKEKELEAVKLELHQRLANRVYLIKSFLTAIFGADFFEGLQFEDTANDVMALYMEAIEALTKQTEAHALQLAETGAKAGRVLEVTSDFLQDFEPAAKW